LEDDSMPVRHGLLRLLAHSRIANHHCLHATLCAMIGSVKKYPLDRFHVWQCATSLGERHSTLASYLTLRLLSVSDHFATHEPDVNDLSYVTIVAFLAAASSHSPEVRFQAPAFFQSHHEYIHAELPQIVSPPVLPDETGGPGIHDAVLPMPEAAARPDPDAYVFEAWGCARRALQEGDHVGAQCILASLQQELKRHSMVTGTSPSPQADHWCGLLALAEWAQRFCMHWTSGPVGDPAWSHAQAGERAG
jgi:hypothetical protein